jgi:hypothetical protein
LTLDENVSNMALVTRRTRDFTTKQRYGRNLSLDSGWARGLFWEGFHPQ